MSINCVILPHQPVEFHWFSSTNCSLCLFFQPDPIFELKVEEKDVLLEALQQPWQVQEKVMETDVSALQWVEDLEQRVIASDLHLKVQNHC